MSYYYSKNIEGRSFEEVVDAVTEALKNEGFGVLTQIDVNEVLKKKLDVDIQRYRILGACNPHFAHKAISHESKIGVFLPCNVVVQEEPSGAISVTAVDPVASMMAVENEALTGIASEVQEKLQRAITQC